MQVVLASHNQGKLREMEVLLAGLDLTLCNLEQLGLPSPDETGSTFLENALLKARAASSSAACPAIADDSGLVVPALGGAPGVHSARYAGIDASDAANNALLIKRLRGVADRRAYFYCAMALLMHREDPAPLVATAAWYGRIVDTPRGEGGFGYDPHFQVDTGHTSAELSADEKNRRSHRGQATLALIRQLRQRRQNHA